MSKVLSDDTVFMAKAIHAMDKMIAKGWKYHWYRQWESEKKTCCLAGAAYGGEYMRPSRYVTISQVALAHHHGCTDPLQYSAAHIANGCQPPPIVIKYDDWPGLRAALCKTYDLSDQAIRQLSQV